MIALEKRAIELEDRLAIQELHNKYVQGYDKMDEEMYMSIWDQNARIDMGSYGSAEGLEDVRIQLYSIWQAMPVTRHIMGSIDIDYKGNTADSISDVLSTAWNADGTALINYVTFRDKLAKKDGKWLITERLMDISSCSAPVTEVWKLMPRRY